MRQRVSQGRLNLDFVQIKYQQIRIGPHLYTLPLLRMGGTSSSKALAGL